MPRDCPVCGIVSPDTTDVCECGFNYMGGAEELRAANQFGLLQIFVGLVMVGIPVALILLAEGEARWVRWVVWGLGIPGAGLVLWGMGIFGRTRHY